MRVAETKALISFAVTAKLICVFVFAYANIRFSHVAAHLVSHFLKVNCEIQRNFLTGIQLQLG